MCVYVILVDSVDTYIYISEKTGRGVQLGDIFTIMYFSETGRRL